jgi:hypothetical protein
MCRLVPSHAIRVSFRREQAVSETTLALVAAGWGVIMALSRHADPAG